MNFSLRWSTFFKYSESSNSSCGFSDSSFGLSSSSSSSSSPSLSSPESLSQSSPARYLKMNHELLSFGGHAFHGQTGGVNFSSEFT